jgi:hypothetical protein
MSIEMQTAFEGDMAVINEDGSKNYVETEEPTIIDAEPETVTEAGTVNTETGEITDPAAALFN